MIPQEICSLIAVTPAHADRYLSRVTRLSGILEEKRLAVVVSEHHLQNFQHHHQRLKPLEILNS